ncbi:MAG: hypothetical protein SFY80_15550, partial [Verrucomicrobiota bacterium]|nr:hypothetical protein [Verrucomicrobiota bacterium]
RRQFIENVIRPRLVEYRALIKGLYPRNHEFVLSLPRANPLPGSTPAGVTLTGGWNALEQKASLSWTECEHPDLDAYEVRACIDGAYRADEDTVVARLPKTALTYTTAHGLAVAGNEVRFRIYAITSVGRERGSNTLHIVRPMPIGLNAAA